MGTQNQEGFRVTAEYKTKEVIGRGQGCMAVWSGSVAGCGAVEQEEEKKNV